MISSAPRDCSSNELCDWLELSVLGSESGRCLLADVNLGLEMGEDFEPEELDEENAERDRRVQQVLAAMDERCQHMPTAYPFRRDGAHVVLGDALSDGAVAYLFCLIVSNAAKSGLLHGDGSWKPDLRKARDLFQVCATVAAAGQIGGPAFATGWPRPDGSTFLVKLTEIYARFGDGRPHRTRPRAAPVQVKDDDIDLIAFREERDRRGGTFYLLAQVASGADWRTKSVQNAVRVFHATWFEQQPASPPIPCLAMPFVLPSRADHEEADHERQEDVAAHYWRTGTEMGVLLYRNRLAQLVDDGVGLYKQGIEPIERLSELPEVRRYVEQYRIQLVAAVESLK